MRTGFYFDVSAVVAGLLLACEGLSRLPFTGWLLNAADGDYHWKSGPLALVALSLAAAVFFFLRAKERPLRLPSIPGMPAKASGIASLVLAVLAVLVLFWWTTAGEPKLPVGPVSYTMGILALVVVAWAATAASALWLGRGTEREREEAELSGDRPIGLA
jgi:MFS-type transporter involved in bile tolerance (Atg22 family)